MDPEMTTTLWTIAVHFFKAVLVFSAGIFLGALLTHSGQP